MSTSDKQRCPFFLEIACEILRKKKSEKMFFFTLFKIMTKYLDNACESLQSFGFCRLQVLQLLRWQVSLDFFVLSLFVLWNIRSTSRINSKIISTIQIPWSSSRFETFAGIGKWIWYFLRKETKVLIFFFSYTIVKIAWNSWMSATRIILNLIISSCRSCWNAKELLIFFRNSWKSRILQNWSHFVPTWISSII